MYLFAKFSGHRSYGNGDINSWIISYMNTSKKAELTAAIRHIERFSKSGIPICISFHKISASDLLMDMRLFSTKLARFQLNSFVYSPLNMAAQ